VSTLADWVGAGTASLAPLTELIRRHVLAAERLHGDDTTVPCLGRGQNHDWPTVDLCQGHKKAGRCRVRSKTRRWRR
jgi:hypothetical protein